MRRRRSACSTAKAFTQGHSHLSKRKYDVTIRIGSAIIVDVHFHAACLYLALEASDGGFDPPEDRGGAGLGDADTLTLGLATGDPAGFGVGVLGGGDF